MVQLLLRSFSSIFVLLAVLVVTGPSRRKVEAAEMNTSSPEPSTTADKYLLWAYRYTSQFNDKVQTWVPSWISSCQSYSSLPARRQRIHVLPSLNVRVAKADGSHLGNEFMATFRFDPFERFFDTDALGGACTFISMSDYISRTDNVVDLAVLDPRLMSKMYGRNCQHNQTVQFDALSKIMAFNETLSFDRVLCWGNSDGIVLREAVQKYDRVFIYGFDSHNDHGSRLQYERTKSGRTNLGFASYIAEEAQRFIHDELNNKSYLAVHWRYNGGSHTIDEITFASKLREWLLQLANSTSSWGARDEVDVLDNLPRAIFLATDNYDEKSQSHTFTMVRQDEDEELSSIQRTYVSLPRVRYVPPVGSAFAEPGVLAVLEQCIASQSDQFLGTRRSTFTMTIAQARAQLGRSRPYSLEYLGSRGSSPVESRRSVLKANFSSAFGNNKERRGYSASMYENTTATLRRAIVEGGGVEAVGTDRVKLDRYDSLKLSFVIGLGILALWGGCRRVLWPFERNAKATKSN